MAISFEKKFSWYFSAAIVLALLALLCSMRAFGANKPATAAKTAPNTFASKGECKAARVSGNYTTYEAKYFGLRDKNPVDGVTRVVAEAETEKCYRMLTTAGLRYVVQARGTKLRYYKNADGTIGRAYARDDCGNPIDDEEEDEGPSPTPVADKPITPKQPAWEVSAIQCPDPVDIIAQTQQRGERKGSIEVHVGCGTSITEVRRNEFKPPGCGFMCGLGGVVGAALAPPQYANVPQGYTGVSEIMVLGVPHSWDGRYYRPRRHHDERGHPINFGGGQSGNVDTGCTQGYNCPGDTGNANTGRVRSTAGRSVKYGRH